MNSSLLAGFINASSPTIEESSSTKFKDIFCMKLSLDKSNIAPYSVASFENTVGACSSCSSPSCSSPSCSS
ncbi:MAG: hypothetical protein P8I23_04745 [SAR86 cluster bacterium]|nr:hypothetical protein [SAR86 cluster bacterium]